jgi:hypothetical protein
MICWDTTKKRLDEWIIASPGRAVKFICVLPLDVLRSTFASLRWLSSLFLFRAPHFAFRALNCNLDMAILCE